MIKKIIDRYKTWQANKKIKQVEEEYDYIRPSEIFKDSYNIEIPDVKIHSNELGKPGILLMDDLSGMTNLIINELTRVQCCDVIGEFNIAVATGDFAAFSVEKFLNNEELQFEINIALLDITLGGVINGVEYDGVDIAIMIKNKFPDALIKFITGHTLNRRNPEIFKFIEKFENYFNLSIDEMDTVIVDGELQKIYKHVIRKNSNRVFELGLTFEEYLDGHKTNVVRLKKFNKTGNNRYSKFGDDV